VAFQGRINEEQLKGKQFHVRKTVTGIFFICLIIRIVLVLRYPQFAPDTQIYDTIALNLTRGLGYTVDGSTPHVIRPPLYPFFLAGIYSVFGHSLLAVRLIQAVIGSLTVIFICKLGLTISDNRMVGIVSALIACFYPRLLMPVAYILSESLTTFLLIVSVWLLTESIKRCKITLGLGAGFLLGLVTLSLPATLAFAAFSCAGLFLIYRRSRRWFPLWAGFSVAMMIAIAPWTIRNYVAFKTFIPVAIDVGTGGSYLELGGDYNVLDYSILVLFIIGIFLPHIRSRERWIPIMMVVYFALSHTIFLAVPRYQITIAPLILTFAGGGLVKLFKSIHFALTSR